MANRRRRITPIHGSLHDAAAASAYTAQGVNINGGVQFDVSALTGIADGPKGILSFWFKFTAGDSNFHILLETHNQTTIALFRNNSGCWQFTTHDSLGNNLFNYIGTTAFNSSMGWNHMLASWDLSPGVGLASVYFTDVLEINATPPSSTIIDYAVAADPAWVMFARGGAIPYTGYIADFYFNTVDFLDFSAGSGVGTANRRKFISAGLAPVDLGATGSIPTGSAPTIFLHGPVASWNTNDGTGGGFTLTSGSLSAAATNPP